MLSVKFIFKPVLTVHHAGILSVVVSISTIETMKYIYMCVCVCTHTYFLVVLVVIMHVKCKEEML
jgi:hypothetical protein